MSERKYKQRGYQDDDRDRRAPRQDGQSQWPGTRPARTPAGRARRRAPHLVGRREESQHAGLPPGRALRPVRHVRRRADLLPQQVPEVPDRICARARSASLRSERALGMHAGDSGARVAQGRRQRLHVLLATHELGARDLIRQSQKPSEPSGAKKAFDDLFKF